MPIEVGIWKLGDTIQRVQFISMLSEKRIEDIIADDKGRITRQIRNRRGTKNG